MVSVLSQLFFYLLKINVAQLKDKTFASAVTFNKNVVHLSYKGAHGIQNLASIDVIEGFEGAVNAIVLDAKNVAETVEDKVSQDRLSLQYQRYGID
ncbi:MAG: hypothetical protein COB76_03200 [Alphaproteobacteria bacterium]|nr:MAG: hypothetical protein COB76_03200 [Alphaproteobacteria bacterium]